MNKLLFTFFLSLITLLSVAGNHTGIYSYNKGLNKASATLYLNQFSEDTAFFMLEALSGMPDFFMNDAKGFMSVTDNAGVYQRKDSCRIEFTFTPVGCTLNENGHCNYECTTNGKYKKTSAQLKKGNSLLPAISDKNGIIAKDSVQVRSAPHRLAPASIIIAKNERVQITDEFNGYYLIELNNKKKEFLWVYKKNIQVLQ